MCVDRTIRCATPPTPTTPITEHLATPNPNDLSEVNSEIRYTCEGRNVYFDYPLSTNFISYFYELALTSIKISCNKEG